MCASFGFLSAAICYGSIIITIAAFTLSAKAKALANRVRSQKVRFLLSQANYFRALPRQKQQYACRATGYRRQPAEICVNQIWSGVAILPAIALAAAT